MAGQRDRIAKTVAAPTATAFRRPTGRASFPRRKTIDLSDEQNDWLAAQAYEGRVSAAGIVRAALAYLAAHDGARRAVVAAAHHAEHPDVDR